MRSLILDSSVFSFCSVFSTLSCICRRYLVSSFLFLHCSALFCYPVCFTSFAGRQCAVERRGDQHGSVQLPVGEELDRSGHGCARFVSAPHIYPHGDSASLCCIFQMLRPFVYAPPPPVRLSPLSLFDIFQQGSLFQTVSAYV